MSFYAGMVCKNEGSLKFKKKTVFVFVNQLPVHTGNGHRWDYEVTTDTNFPMLKKEVCFCHQSHENIILPQRISVTFKSPCTQKFQQDMPRPKSSQSKKLCPYKGQRHISLQVQTYLYLHTDLRPASSTNLRGPIAQEKHNR